MHLGGDEAGLDGQRRHLGGVRVRVRVSVSVRVRVRIRVRVRVSCTSRCTVRGSVPRRKSCSEGRGSSASALVGTASGCSVYASVTSYTASSLSPSACTQGVDRLRGGQATS